MIPIPAMLIILLGMSICEYFIIMMWIDVNNTGKWERYVNDYKKCSKCGAIVKSYHDYKFCPNCGARMEEEV